MEKKTYAMILFMRYSRKSKIVNHEHKQKIAGNCVKDRIKNKIQNCFREINFLKNYTVTINIYFLINIHY